MLLEVYNQIGAILAVAKTNLLANSNLILTVPNVTPTEKQSYEHYVAIVAMRHMTFSQEPATGGNQKQKAVTINMSLDIFSAPVGEYYAWSEVTNMMIVIDGVMDEFNLRPGLEDADWNALRHLNPDGQVLLSNGTQDIAPYPVGTANNCHHFSIDISVPYFWTCPGNRS